MDNVDVTVLTVEDVIKIRHSLNNIKMLLNGYMGACGLSNDHISAYYKDFDDIDYILEKGGIQ